MSPEAEELARLREVHARQAAAFFAANARVEALEAALAQCAYPLAWADRNWTRPAAQRGTGLPMMRAALRRALELLPPHLHPPEDML